MCHIQYLSDHIDHTAATPSAYGYSNRVLYSNERGAVSLIYQLSTESANELLPVEENLHIVKGSHTGVGTTYHYSSFPSFQDLCEELNILLPAWIPASSPHPRSTDYPPPLQCRGTIQVAKYSNVTGYSHCIKCCTIHVRGNVAVKTCSPSCYTMWHNILLHNPT